MASRADRANSGAIKSEDFGGAFMLSAVELITQCIPIVTSSKRGRIFRPG